ncbi:DUF2202 domain-containing protein [Kineosporia sp. A_224]|uniref:ferritin-like domain-containing protein n=1 Tax=Kineosporia sp. A_224 TaxID=1962180 RepID=UPI00117ABCEA|nr:DUF2202 domain-containing protein [Kineosporia sp. A_224]
MNSRTTRTALVTAAVAGGAGVLLLATPVVANTTGWGGGPGTRTTATNTATTCPMTDDDTGTGYGMGNGMRNGMRGRADGNGYGMRNGGGMMGDPGANLPASGTLTDAQKSTLAGMAEEEKLAHDVYVVLAGSTGDRRFTMIAASEARHLSAVRTLLDRYDVTDPTVGKADGSFTTPAVQSLYDSLVAEGKSSLTAALTVGQKIEKLDIADLAKAGADVKAADVTTVYSRLSAASQHHLAAFGG